MVGPERTLLRDDRRYIAHPHLAALRDGSWRLVATAAPRRAVTLHPPLDPAFTTIGIRSLDEGESWSDPEPLPAAGHTGTECSGLTALPDGAVLLNQWRFRWYDEADREGLADGLSAEPDRSVLASADDLQRELDTSRELDGPAPAGSTPWTRGGGTLTLWRAEPGRNDWTLAAEPDLRPYPGGYGLRGGLALPDGDIILPLTDPPHYRSVFLIRSRDGGWSWSPPEPVASKPGCFFEEPAPVLLPDGVVLMLLRENASRRLHSIRSRDDGATWSEPRPTTLPGFPAHALALRDGRIAALTATREPPGAILLSLSADGGDTWSADPVVVAGDLGTHDLGYPTAAETTDGSLFVAYYRRDSTGVTGIHARRVAMTTIN